MSSSSELNGGYRKRSLRNAQALLARQFQKSSPAMATSRSAYSQKSPRSWDATSRNSSNIGPSESTMQNLSGAQKRRRQSSSTQRSSSTQSTKQTKYDTAVPAGQKAWHVKLHRDVGKQIAGYALSDKRFSPTLRQLIAALEAKPKQFPKKKGKLKDARAAELSFKT